MDLDVNAEGHPGHAADADRGEQPDPIASLDEAEKLIVELLQKASSITKEIEHGNSVDRLSEEYVAQCARLRSLLIDPLASLLLNNPPQHEMSTYGDRQDVANAMLAVKLLQDELRLLSGRRPGSGS